MVNKLGGGGGGSGQISRLDQLVQGSPEVRGVPLRDTDTPLPAGVTPREPNA